MPGHHLDFIGSCNKLQTLKRWLCDILIPFWTSLLARSSLLHTLAGDPCRLYFCYFQDDNGTRPRNNPQHDRRVSFVDIQPNCYNYFTWRTDRGREIAGQKVNPVLEWPGYWLNHFTSVGVEWQGRTKGLTHWSRLMQFNYLIKVRDYCPFKVPAKQRERTELQNRPPK